MRHFELEPIPCEPDGHEGFPLSFKVYDTFRGRVLVGEVTYMLNLKVFRPHSIYASAEEIRKSFSIMDSEKWKGDISYKNTCSIEEARKLYKLYLAKLDWKERIARTLDVWWPVCIGFSSIMVAIASIPVGVMAAIEIISK